MPNETKPFPLVNDFHVPEIVASDATGFLNLGGAIAITLECAKSDYSQTPPEVSRVVVGRLIMPTGAAQGLAEGLFNYLKTQGLDPSAGTDGEA